MKQNDKELPKALKQQMKEQAKNNLELERLEDIQKQNIEIQKQKQREEYLKAREQQMLSPEYLQQQEKIAEMKVNVNYAKHINDLKEQELKAKELEQQHKNNLHTLNIVASLGERLSPSTIGQLYSQINSEREDDKKELTKRASEMNEFNELMGRFKTKYGDESQRVYNELFKDIKGAAPDMETDSLNISKANALLKYTLDNLPAPDEDGALPLADFLKKDNVKDWLSLPPYLINE